MRRWTGKAVDKNNGVCTSEHRLEFTATYRWGEDRRQKRVDVELTDGGYKICYHDGFMGFMHLTWDDFEGLIDTVYQLKTSVDKQKDEFFSQFKGE